MFPAATTSVAPLVYGVLVAALACAVVLAVIVARDARAEHKTDDIRRYRFNPGRAVPP